MEDCKATYVHEGVNSKLSRSAINASWELERVQNPAAGHTLLQRAVKAMRGVCKMLLKPRPGLCRLNCGGRTYPAANPADAKTLAKDDQKLPYASHPLIHARHGNRARSGHRLPM